MPSRRVTARMFIMDLTIEYAGMSFPTLGSLPPADGGQLGRLFMPPFRIILSIRQASRSTFTPSS